MSAGPAGRLRAGLAVPALFVLVALATFVGLGTWQIQRKAWKDMLIDMLERRLSAPPVELPPSVRWEGLDRSEDEFRRVKLTVEFPAGREAVVYAASPAFRPDVRSPGYFLFTPAQTADGGLVVVNRGFVPEPRSQADRYAKPAGSVNLVGVLRWPEQPSWFVREYDPAEDTWFARNPVEMTARYGWGRVAPFYVEVEGPPPPGGLPRPGALRVNLRNEHLQYAITWYGLAAVVVVMFAFWLMSRRAAVRGS